jgi:hypothetical protein
VTVGVDCILNADHFSRIAFFTFDAETIGSPLSPTQIIAARRKHPHTTGVARRQGSAKALSPKQPCR